MEYRNDSPSLAGGIVLYNYQKKAIDILKRYNRVILAYDTGLGKSLIVLKAFENEKILYVGSRTSIISFREEIKKWYPNKKIWESKDNVLDINKSDIFLITIKKHNLVKEIIKNSKCKVIVFDEAHNYFKNKNTQTYWEWGLVLSDIKKQIPDLKIVALTATPFVNSKDDYYNIRLMLMDIKNSFVYFDRKTHQDVSNEIKLPKLNVNAIRLQEYFYYYMSKSFKIGDYYTKDKLFSISPKLAGYEKVGFINSDKINETLKLLEKLEGKTVIFSQFRKSLQYLKSFLKPEECVYVDGTKTIKKRNEIINEFKNNPKIKYLLITLKTGGDSLNLQECKNVIFLDLWWTHASLHQAINRVRRINSQHNEVNVYLIINTTLGDLKSLQAINRKRKASQILNIL
ncbi:MAG: DEAD/DEAH box helicase family protein [Candidatus Omnitrophica bacterium]|nr:DEAD/DEAH box helicase family protein [Candidatus Omnitrophota bacterium]